MNVPIDSGISRAEYCRNDPGDGISVDISYSIPNKCPQQPTLKKDFHKLGRN